MLRAAGVLVGTLVTLGFYNVTDSLHLEGDVLLNTADRLAYTVCHRLPSHGFEIFGRSFPLCARCSGIYLGILWGLGYLATTHRLRHARYPNRRALLILAALVGLMAVDGFNSLFHDLGLSILYHPQNWLRLLTGLGTGLAIILIVVPTFAQTAWRNPIWESAIDGRDALILACGAFALFGLLITGYAPLLYALALLSTLTVPLIITLLYTILVLLFTRRDNSATRARALALPLLGGALLASTQIMVLFALRSALMGQM